MNPRILIPKTVLPKAVPLTWLFASLIAFLSLDVASAQFTYPSTQPSVLQPQPQANRTQLSPYLNLLRNDSSALSPYHTFVLPRRQQQQLQTMQGVQIRSLERTVNERANLDRRTRSQTGRGGYFQSYLHFYAPSR